MALAPLMTPLIGIPAPLVEYRYHGGNMMNSPKPAEESPQSAKRKRSLILAAGKLHFKVSREYLAKIDPVLAEVLLPMDKRPEALHTAYMEARKQTWWGALSPYRDMVADEGFLTKRLPSRWFWRLSILLPLPILNYAWTLDHLKLWLWRAVEVPRRLF